jgi:hypothetical protein
LQFLPGIVGWLREGENKPGPARSTPAQIAEISRCMIPLL